MDNVGVNIVTNALLLTPEFITEYFGYNFTQLVISLDTDNAENDHRDITQEGIDYIFEMMSLIPQEVKNKRVTIRCTINKESVAALDGFVDHLYQVGIRDFVIHPLIMSKEFGIIDWDDATWNHMHQIISKKMHQYRDFQIVWAEGVGVKGESNCMVGTDMIAMDASGDFSGCYFFTNLKESFGHTMLGNIFRNEIYIDRYQKFQKEYLSLQEREECKTCDLKNFCYQCPAGNAATGGQFFRPDGTCKRIVKLFLTLREDENRKTIINKFNNIEETQKTEGEVVRSRTIIHLMFRAFTKTFIEKEVLLKYTNLPHYKNVLMAFKKAIESTTPYQVPVSLDVWLDKLWTETDQISAYEFYRFICEKNNIPLDFDYTPQFNDTEENYFLALLHLLVIDNSQYQIKHHEDHTRSRIFEL